MRVSNWGRAPSPNVTMGAEGDSSRTVAPFSASRSERRRTPMLGNPAPEVNVRTYVKGPDGKTGVWFCTLDSDDWLAVKTANIAFGLPYRIAKTRFEQTHETMNWTSERKSDLAKVELVVRKTVGLSRDAEPGLEQFLVERYALYTLRRGKLLRGRLEHERWKVKNASLEHVVHETVDSEGIIVSSGAHVLIGEPVEVTVYPLRRVRELG